jgi:hypothetical protein
LVVANLQFPPDDKPRPDVNTRRDFVTGRGSERDLPDDDTTDPDAELNPGL